MAGVAGPMLRHDRAGAIRFLLGLLIGGLAGSVVLAVPFYVLGRLTEALLTEQVRWVVFGVVVVVAGVVDLTLRTPHVQRQVPQRLVRTLKPGPLGLVWGVDLAMLFTTQKTTSLLWVALAGLVLVAPGLAPALLAASWAVAWLAMVYLSVRRPTLIPIGEERLTWQDLVKILRRVSGTILLGTAVIGAFMLS
ncbi:hypothetical protein [Plantactinospora soyae]|uniref:Multisubunit Na+/H+ antiporter MnhE subunit n=1 Tax=Plantactinospora soyae TaxID=1544732 RepID=A0A927MFK2_9ACTN|nr:hypothetical protein [Plantactinospora soyae]MBE1492785.1 multisubunit Na+/H+ antiporter MnhE subunit [Plantactinospora soyae]